MPTGSKIWSTLKLDPVNWLVNEAKWLIGCQLDPIMVLNESVKK